MSASASRAILSATQDNQFGAGAVMRFTVGSVDTRFELKGTTQTLGGIDSTGFLGSFAAIQHNEFSTGAAVDGTSVLILNVTGSNSFLFGNAAGGTAVVRDFTGGTVSIIKNGTGYSDVAGKRHYLHRQHHAQ
jgi:hypothetical protein